MHYLFEREKKEFCTVDFTLYSTRIQRKLEMDKGYFNERYSMSCSEAFNFLMELGTHPISYSGGRPLNLVTCEIKTEVNQKKFSDPETPVKAAARIQLFMKKHRAELDSYISRKN